MSTLSALPELFAAGTTVAYTRSVSEYPASAGWVLTLILRGRDQLDVTAVASGDAFQVTISATQSAGLRAGTYEWVERVAKAGVAYDVGSGSVLVTMNLATAAAGDARPIEEQWLEWIDLAMAKRLPSHLEGYVVLGRQMTNNDPSAMLRLRVQVEWLLFRRRTGKISRTHPISFTGTGNES